MNGVNTATTLARALAAHTNQALPREKLALREPQRRIDEHTWQQLTCHMTSTRAHTGPFHILGTTRLTAI